MELYNKSKRTFTVAHPEPNDENKGVHHAKPETTFSVSKEEGEKLLELYPNEILKASEAEEQVKDLESELLKAYEQIETLKQEVADLKAKKATKKA